MANITAAMVKELRDKTDAGMMDCKKALTETNGDMEAAVEYLRKTGAAKAEKRADKATKEGKVFAAVDGNKAVMIEVLCETDFVAGNEKFFDYVKEAAGRVLAATSGDGDVTEKAQELENNNLKELFVKFGEKMVLRRAVRFESAGIVSSYMHGNGKIGIMIDVEGTTDPELLKAICMHIAAYSPMYVNSSEVPADAIAKEKEIAAAQLAGKPANMDALMEMTCAGSAVAVKDALVEKIAVIGEKISIRRFVIVEGLVSTYIHGMGATGVIVKFDAPEAVAATAEFAEFAKNIALQIAAGNPPKYVTREEVPAAEVEEEKAVLIQQAKNDPKNANKPDAILEKMVGGRLGKFYERVCLVDQPYVKEDKMTVGQYVAATAKALGGAITVLSFEIFEKGEGIEKREENFAEEIAKLAGGAN